MPQNKHSLSARLELNRMTCKKRCKKLTSELQHAAGHRQNLLRTTPVAPATLLLLSRSPLLPQR
ncbi:hypothetical protein J6590_018551 [Homalodisca vitripennis]|nr:hypothetical protein J6590_096198 [Homalodisca vitripennis]KAG8303086.1 hypothetical protein J6590_018551 [Homalodisca vitripennis]